MLIIGILTLMGLSTLVEDLVELYKFIVYKIEGK